MMSKWCLPLSGVHGQDQASDRSRACQRKAGRSCAPTQTWASTPGRGASRAGLSCGNFRRIEAQVGVHGGERDRLQIGKRRYRHDPLDRRRQGDIGATHPGAEMTACGMAGDDDRTRDETRSDLDSARDLLGHRADPRFGRERVRGHGAGPSARHGACGQMRPHVAIEPQPIAAVDEHQKTLRRGLGQKEVKSDCAAPGP